MGVGRKRDQYSIEEDAKVKTEQVYLDLVRKYFPNLSDEEADKVLWDHTPFPMRYYIQEIESYLIEYSKLVSSSTVYGPAMSSSNSTRFAEFLNNLSDDEYERFENMIMREVQKYE